MILTDGKERYLSDSSWVPAAVGEHAEILRTQDWGPVTERRIVLPSGLEIELGFAGRSWALANPVEPGTARVIREGCSPLVDPEGAFARLIAAVGARRAEMPPNDGLAMADENPRTPAMR